MKKLVTISLAFLSFSSFAACLSLDNGQLICTGDVVFKGNTYTQGAKVVAINQQDETVSVKSVLSPTIFKEDPINLDFTEGCAQGACVGDIVFRGNVYSQGARILAVNQDHHRVTLKSLSTGSVLHDDSGLLDFSHGCTQGICVGDTVVKGNVYSQGAQVLGVNISNHRVTVRSNSTGSALREDSRQLEIMH